MSARSRWLRYSVGLFSLSLFLTACGTLPVDTMRECVDNCKPRGNVCHKPTMMSLARDLDHLERHIESHGSIVIQKPAVWGQARLTQYRQEFEEQMVQDVKGFQQTLQGSISRSDQAFFVNAMAISAAVSGDVAVKYAPKDTYDSTGAKVVQQQIIEPAKPADLPKFAGDTTNSQITTPGLGSNTIVKSSDFSGALKDGSSTLKISLEPTIYLEQKARYLNYLQQIRRTNEGDDTTDSPGYALHLMRIPVSVLPGKCTQAGHGAEVTLSLTPSLGDELLPVTFRNLVINDLVDQLSTPLIGFLNSDEVKTHFSDSGFNGLDRKNLIDADPPAMPSAVSNAANGIVFVDAKKPADFYIQAGKNIPSREKFAKAAQRHLSATSRPAISGAQGLRLAFPPSQIYDNFGLTFAAWVAFDAYQTFQGQLANRNLIHLPDLQAYMKEELNAAYKFLTTNQNQSLWTLCNHDLAEAIRNRQVMQIAKIREAYCTIVRDSVTVDDKPNTVKEKVDIERMRKNVELSTTSALGWAILVNSALLNERLNNDMREVASAKGLACRKDWLPFYLPDPPAEARAAFIDYVRQRWPIHVFALDPITQDQNLADVFSSRREMQLALSLAFASGKINGQQLTRFARRIEAQYDTIALNRTSVGFSHGDDTFGWRFYPRFQTPDIEGNLKVLTRDMLIGGPNRNQLLNQRKLEPGIRECVAIVLMPAFVPYVNCDVSTHWFKLTNPKHMSGDSTEALKLSRQVKSMQVCAGNVRDADCYRDGDFLRLLRKVDQLSARLPLQTHQFQVPYENTIGGFQMFNTGVTDLAPELDGWYGAPGISTKSATTLFLVGRNLSVRNTQVVAGGRRVTNVELLSRQVIRVEIPSNIEVKKDRDGRLNVDIHVATPYGVTQHLQVPTVVDSVPAQSGFSIVGASGDQVLEATLKDKKLAAVNLKPENVTFTVVNQTRPPVDLNVNTAKVKWKLSLTSANGANTDLKEFTTMPDLVFKDRKAPFEVSDLQAKVEAYLKTLNVTWETGAQIRADGYLEVVLNSANNDPRTLAITLDNALIWRVTVK